MITDKKQWSRKCPNPNNNPNCKNIIYYSRIYEKNRADKNNSICKSCIISGLNNPSKQPEICKKISNTKKDKKSWNKGLTKETDVRIKKLSNSKTGIKFSKEHCRKISNANKGKKISDKTKQKISKSVTGINNPRYGKSNYDIWLKKYGKIKADKKLKIFKIKTSIKSKNRKFNNTSRNKISKIHKGIPKTKEHKKKIRLSILENIKNRCGQIIPNYNPSSIPIIEAKAKELGITDIQHAENGGEFNIKEIGYWVDGYSKEKNIVIEYYEPFHENQKERDERRKQEIINKLNCEFIEIKE